MNRSQSCPELTFDSYKSPIPRRKRALSEHFFNEDEYAKEVNPRPLQIQSRHSETNLMRIDKEKTFNQPNVFDNTGELLAQVVFALNSFNPNIEETTSMTTANNVGINLFSDESILEDEWSVITAPSDLKSAKNLRKRAKSLHPQNSKMTNKIETKTPQFTWSGDNNDIQDYINAQFKNSKKKSIKKLKIDNNGVVINVDKVKDCEPNPNQNRRKSIFTAINNVFRRRNTTAAPNVEAPIDETETSKPMAKATFSSNLKRTASMRVDGPHKIDHVRRPSILSNHSSCSNQEHVLENTTIADLIRAIESVHVNNVVGPRGLDNLTNRRLSSAVQSARRASVSFSTPLETPPSAGSNRLNVPRPSMAIPRNRIMTMRQNSSPNRFSVTPVLDSPSSAASLSPMIQRRIRRFSAVPPSTIMPQRSLSTSPQATPLAIRRTQFKQIISPLAMPQQPESTSNTLKNSKSPVSLLSKTLSITLDQSENADAMNDK